MQITTYVFLGYVRRYVAISVHVCLRFVRLTGARARDVWNRPDEDGASISLGQ